MKIVHVLKRIETIDNDIKDLKKLEKSISREKSFSTPIYMSIEQQINILLAERVKLFELEVSNPPDTLVQQIEGEESADVEVKPLLPSKSKTSKKSTKKTDKKGSQKSTQKNSSKSTQKSPGKQQNAVAEEPDDDDLPFRMLTQDQIDNRISDIESEESSRNAKKEEKTEKSPESGDSTQAEAESEAFESVDTDDEAVKLLDIALDKDSDKKKSAPREKKRVRFFKDNFPGGEY